MEKPLTIDHVIRQAASAAMKGVHVSKVYSKPTSDSDGRDALHVTIIFKPKAKKEVTGDAALDAIVGIQRALQEFGEERFPIVDFAYESELNMNADP